MKTIKLVILSLVMIGKAFAQSEAPGYMGYLEAGYQRGYTSKDHFLNEFKFGFNSVIKDKYLIGLNYTMAFENKYLKKAEPDHINNYTLPYINFGIRSKLAKSWYICPSIGVGYGNYTLTQLKGETTGELDFDLSGNVSTKFETVYNTEKESIIAVPVNLNILYTTKYVGLGLNVYMTASKYFEVGAGLSLNFGKVRN